MKKNIITLLTLFLMMCVEKIYAHEHHEHVKQDSAKIDSTEHSASDHNEIESLSGKVHESGKVTAEWNDFPTLHPMVVHFPIVFLLVAVLLQVISLFTYRKEMSWAATLLTLLGFLGALFAGEYLDIFHPDIAELPKNAQAVYDLHKTFADFTLWISAAALLVKVASHYFFQRKWLTEILATVLLLAAAGTVSAAGHYGAQLVHIEGVGPQGKYLEPHDGGTHHGDE